MYKFPVITEDLQSQYEQISKCSQNKYTPDICGYHGRACRQMGKEEGANRALCTNCDLKGYGELHK